MAKFPEPPDVAALVSVGASLRVVSAGAVIWRIYQQAGAHPTTWGRFRSWGPTDARFDHHDEPARDQDRAVLYGAWGPRAAVTTVAEVFQDSRVVDRTRRAPAWVAFSVERDLRLLDLTGAWPTRAGASMVLGSGTRARARRWSQAIYAAFPTIDGLVYASSMHANQPCVALFERAQDAMPERPMFHRQLADPAVLTLLKNACDEVGYSLI